MDIAAALTDVCFSNRPFSVKHFQTIHQCGVDVARGLVLLFGIGTWALQPWDPRTRRNNLSDDLAVSVPAGPIGHTNSPHPSSREGHLSTAGWISSLTTLITLTRAREVFLNYACQPTTGRHRGHAWIS